MSEKWLIKIRSKSGKEDFIVANNAYADAIMEIVRYLCAKRKMIVELDGPISWYSFTRVDAD